MSYLHGYGSEEQQRLVAQAAYWRDTLITPWLDYRAGQSMLEIGCGVGAVLGVVTQHTPGLHLAGIDLEPRQIDFARRYLASLPTCAPAMRRTSRGRTPPSTTP
jgi:cyclopropane fatty-acyl-phospholipid synthase-like methyltransferase